MSEILGWIADGVLILLLGGTLVMAVRLDRALRIVGGDRAAFEALITNLGAATNAVKGGIQALRTEAERAADQIERRSEDADKMATDLSFLIEAADRAGARLEQRVVATPKAVQEQSRKVTAAYRLRGGAKYPRLRRTEAAVPDAPPAAAPMPQPAPTLRPATIRFEDDTPAALRQMAGITTKKRVVEQPDPAPIERAEPDAAAWEMRDESYLQALQMKRAG